MIEFSWSSNNYFFVLQKLYWTIKPDAWLLLGINELYQHLTLVIFNTTRMLQLLILQLLIPLIFNFTDFKFNTAATDLVKVITKILAKAMLPEHNVAVFCSF